MFMKQFTQSTIVPAVCLAVCLAAVLVVPPVFAEKSISAAVSIAPQKYFVEKIAGDLVKVAVMVPPGAAAERYEPKPQQMVALSNSRVYFACGVPFEDAWLAKMAAAAPGMLVVRTDAGIEKRRMEAHSHGDEEESEVAGQGQAHEGLMKDPHIWLSPPLVMIQARNILDGLLKVDPAHKEAYDAGYSRFIGELADLDIAIRNIFWGKGAKIRFMVFHPAWGYFADAYGLTQIPVEMEGKEPKARDLEKLIRVAKDLGIQTVFIQPQFSAKSAQTLAEAIGGRTLPADDLAEDWAGNLRRAAESIAASAR